MNKINLKSDLGIAIILGSTWGLAEVALGLGLRACAHLVSGSVMTGVALFFICAGWIATRRFTVPVMIVLIACLFKLFDALLLSLPVASGTILNPVFAFLTEAVAFITLIAIFNNSRWHKKYSRALLGAGSAMIAVCLFPLVRFVSGTPACLYAGTQIPLSIFFAPVAIVVSAITVPLGFLVGDKIRSIALNPELAFKRKTYRYMVTPATLVLCLTLIVCIRLIFNNV